MQKPMTATRSQPVASAAASASARRASSENCAISAMRDGMSRSSWPGKGSGAHTTQPCSAASRAHMSSNSGRSPMMSGKSTTPSVGSTSPSGRASSAGVPVGRVMRTVPPWESTGRRPVGGAGQE